MQSGTGTGTSGIGIAALVIAARRDPSAELRFPIPDSRFPMTFGAHYEHRPTEAYPVMQRTGIKFFRNVAQTGRGIFAGIGQRGFFMRDIGRAFSRARRRGARETIQQMRNIGVDSVPLVVIVAGFLGAVTAFQAFYQLFAGVQLSVLGLLVRGSIVLELGPLLTALVLTGRVGARMTAEIGTMRVTEQIDALETLAYDPIAYLVVPRLLAALVMFPVLTIIANATAIVIGVAHADHRDDRDDERLRDGACVSASRRSRWSTA